MDKSIRNGYVIKLFDPWRSPLCTCPIKYSLHPYTGCSHQCVYCYATSYIRVRKSIPKRDLIQKLKRDLRKVNPALPIVLSTSSDPYPPEELQYKLTRKVLELLVPRGFKILIVTKGTIITRDLDLLSKGNAAVTMTITTIHDYLSKKLEPNAPPSSSRLEALRRLVNSKVPVGVRVDPIIPYINDDVEDIYMLLKELKNIGVKFIVTSTYKARPDSLKRLTNAFPEIARKVNELYRKHGIRVHGYIYLPLDLRIKILKNVISIAKQFKMKYAICREGLGQEFTNSPTCDGTHLIPIRIKLQNQGVDIGRR